MGGWRVVHLNYRDKNLGTHILSNYASGSWTKHKLTPYYLVYEPSLIHSVLISCGDQKVWPLPVLEKYSPWGQKVRISWRKLGEGCRYSKGGDFGFTLTWWLILIGWILPGWFVILPLYWISWLSGYPNYRLSLIRAAPVTWRHWKWIFPDLFENQRVLIWIHIYYRPLIVGFYEPNKVSFISRVW